MKKIIAVCLVVVLCIGLWFFGYYNRKSNDNIPTKELIGTTCLNKGEDHATEQLKGYKNTQLMEVWGKPDGSLSGMWGDIWETSNTYNLIVYYDSNGIVEHVKVMNEDNKLQATVLEISNNYFIVEPVEGSWELNSADRIEVPMEKMSPSPEPQIGDTLEIVYCGNVLETNPARLTGIQSIRVIEKAISKDDENKLKYGAWFDPDADNSEYAVSIPETPNALIPSIMYNGELYRTTGKQIPAAIDESAYAGKITSTVPLSVWPSEEGQANFGEIGTPYAVTSDGFVVLMNNEWTVFEVME